MNKTLLGIFMMGTSIGTKYVKMRDFYFWWFPWFFGGHLQWLLNVLSEKPVQIECHHCSQKEHCSQLSVALVMLLASLHLQSSEFSLFIFSSLTESFPQGQTSLLKVCFCFLLFLLHFFPFLADFSAWDFRVKVFWGLGWEFMLDWDFGLGPLVFHF